MAEGNADTGCDAVSETRRRSTLRRLSPEEIELWLGVAESVERRPGATLPARLEAPPKPEVVAAPAPPTPLPQPAPPRAPSPQPRLERKLKQQLSRGRVSADAAIDLHGFRQAEALSALRHFLLGAQAQGARVVLVVTGKGGRSPDMFDMTGGEVGVLRRAVPLWLGLPEFRHLVVGYEEAAPWRGGAGALYVRLRRPGR